MNTTHRAWLEALRAKLSHSGLTVDAVAREAGWSKSKISELLRGVGLYPRWEIAYGVVHVLRVPPWPMQRLWASAAAEAHKKPHWIEGCIDEVAVPFGKAEPPLDHRGFTELYRPAYLSYSRTFLPDHQAQRAVRETLDVLWLRWDEALASHTAQHFAWPILRRSVMARTPHIAGFPELTHAAFETLALNRATGPAALAQLEESTALFHAISHLPATQLDVMVLRYLRGMPEEAVADLLGTSIAFIRSTDRHAQRSLISTLDPGPLGGTPS